MFTHHTWDVPQVAHPNLMLAINLLPVCIDAFVVLLASPRNILVCVDCKAATTITIDSFITYLNSCMLVTKSYFLLLCCCASRLIIIYCHKIAVFYLEIH